MNLRYVAWGHTQVPILACPDVSSISKNWCTGEGGAIGDGGIFVPGGRLMAAVNDGLGTYIYSLHS